MTKITRQIYGATRQIYRFLCTRRRYTTIKNTTCSKSDFHSFLFFAISKDMLSFFAFSISQILHKYCPLRYEWCEVGINLFLNMRVMSWQKIAWHDRELQYNTIQYILQGAFTRQRKNGTGPIKSGTVPIIFVKKQWTFIRSSTGP